MKTPKDHLNKCSYALDKLRYHLEKLDAIDYETRQALTVLGEKLEKLTKRETVKDILTL